MTSRRAQRRQGPPSTLPPGVHTVHLVDAEGRSWGSMSREQYDDLIERQTAHDVILRDLVSAYRAVLGHG